MVPIFPKDYCVVVVFIITVRRWDKASERWIYVVSNGFALGKEVSDLLNEKE